MDSILKISPIPSLPKRGVNAIFSPLETVSQLQTEGREAVKKDGDILIASLPVSSYAEFEKELAKIGSPPATPRAIVEQEMKDDLRLAARVKSKESEERGIDPSRSMALREDTVSIRIRLIPE